ncbi:MAG: hypothetical protein PWR10_1574 [Halanaerobiales bacterium]|nr:hypothetical protein [Halanaerobiales bacterium]
MPNQLELKIRNLVKTAREDIKEHSYLTGDWNRGYNQGMSIILDQLEQFLADENQEVA